MDYFEGMYDMHRKIISQFWGIIIAMNDTLCIPSIRAKYQEEEMEADFGGRIREISKGFPRDKAELVLKWVLLHKEEIQVNHCERQGKEPFDIEPFSL